MNPTSAAGGLGIYFTWPWILFGLIVVAGTAALVTAGIVYLERQRRRDRQATEAQIDLVNALSRELGNKANSVRPTVQCSGRFQYTVELVGAVDSPDLQAAVRRIVNRQMSRVARSFEIVDHLSMTQPGQAPSPGASQ